MTPMRAKAGSHVFQCLVNGTAAPFLSCQFGTMFTEPGRHIPCRRGAGRSSSRASLGAGCPAGRRPCVDRNWPNIGCCRSGEESGEEKRTWVRFYETDFRCNFSLSFQLGAICQSAARQRSGNLRFILHRRAVGIPKQDEALARFARFRCYFPQRDLCRVGKETESFQSLSGGPRRDFSRRHGPITRHPRTPRKRRRA